MEDKKKFPFYLILVAAFMGYTLYNDFNFENMRFRNVAIDIIYLITFFGAIILMIKNLKDRGQQD